MSIAQDESNNFGSASGANVDASMSKFVSPDAVKAERLVGDLGSAKKGNNLNTIRDTTKNKFTLLLLRNQTSTNSCTRWSLMKKAIGTF
jgi:hypothetical protein